MVQIKKDQTNLHSQHGHSQKKTFYFESIYNGDKHLV